QLGPTPAAAQVVCAAGACTKQVTVRPGGSVALMPGAALFNHADCSFRPVDLNVVVRPKQGRVVPRLIATTIVASPNFNPTGRCVGRPTKGLQVTYHANRNASGFDEVVIRVTTSGSSGSAILRYRIAIQ